MEVKDMVDLRWCAIQIMIVILELGDKSIQTFGVGAEEALLCFSRLVLLPCLFSKRRNCLPSMFDLFVPSFPAGKNSVGILQQKKLVHILCRCNKVKQSLIRETNMFSHLDSIL